MTRDIVIARKLLSMASALVTSALEWGRVLYNREYTLSDGSTFLFHAIEDRPESQVGVTGGSVVYVSVRRSGEAPTKPSAVSSELLSVFKDKDFRFRTAYISCLVFPSKLPDVVAKLDKAFPQHQDLDLGEGPPVSPLV